MEGIDLRCKTIPFEKGTETRVWRGRMRTRVGCKTIPFEKGTETETVSSATDPAPTDARPSPSRRGLKQQNQWRRLGAGWRCKTIPFEKGTETLPASAVGNRPTADA